MHARTCANVRTNRINSAYIYVRASWARWIHGAREIERDRDMCDVSKLFFARARVRVHAKRIVAVCTCARLCARAIALCVANIGLCFSLPA